MKRTGNSSLDLKRIFERLEKRRIKAFWLDVHMKPLDKMRERRKDYRYSKFLAYPQHKRAMTLDEAQGFIQPNCNNVVELDPDYNSEQRKLQAERVKKRMRDPHEVWFQDYADIFLTQK